MGQCIPRLTLETYTNAIEDRRETLANLGQSPGSWLVAALAHAEMQELDRFAIELGIIPDQSQTDRPEQSVQQ